ncbi:Multidomain esterase [Erysiphe neolycopersici]|uniref:Multidomain esterase n=1 Tax=Erysiphe neolycopersici TaxID=212602 RepID=A0A420HUY6_9PEZI|nr:Multidomain esterase [Erysiphe neolycopersici]
MKHYCEKILTVQILISICLSFHITKSTAQNVPQDFGVETSSRSSATKSLPNLRILPLGDSITQGFGSSSGNGYRAQLQDMLNYSSPSVTYIGSQKSGNMSNNVHEGYPGAVIDEIASQGLPLLAQKPNLILVMAGTNDISRAHNVDDAPKRLGALVDLIIQNSPLSTIIVAELLPILNPPESEESGKLFNAKIPEILALRQKAGNKVLLVKMSSGFSKTDLEDGLHPNDKGYKRIADTWYSGIQQVNDLGWLQEPISVDQKKGQPK